MKTVSRLVNLFLTVQVTVLYGQGFSSGLRSSGARNPFEWVVEEKFVVKQSEKKKSTDTLVSVPWQLAGISISNNKPCALFVNEGQTKVARKNDSLGEEWKVEKITTACVQLRHCTGQYKELKV